MARFARSCLIAIALFVGSLVSSAQSQTSSTLSPDLTKLLQQIKAADTDLLAVSEEDGRFLRVNEATLPVLGYMPDEILGKTYLDLVDADEVARVSAVDAGLRTGQNTIKDFESRWRRKDGQYIHLSLSVRWSEHNQLMYATARDVTERIEAQIPGETHYEEPRRW